MLQACLNTDYVHVSYAGIRLLHIHMSLLDKMIMVTSNPANLAMRHVRLYVKSQPIIAGGQAMYCNDDWAADQEGLQPWSLK